MRCRPVVARRQPDRLRSDGADVVDRIEDEQDGADDDRVGGWMLMREMLERGELCIGANCGKLITTLPQMRRDERKVEDCLKFEGDDAADSARYALKSRLGAGRPPMEERVLARLDTSGRQADLHSRILMYQQIANEEKKKDKPIKFFTRPKAGGWRHWR